MTAFDTKYNLANIRGAIQSITRIRVFYKPGCNLPVKESMELRAQVKVGTLP